MVNPAQVTFTHLRYHVAFRKPIKDEVTAFFRELRGSNVRLLCSFSYSAGKRACFVHRHMAAGSDLSSPPSQNHQFTHSPATRERAQHTKSLSQADFLFSVTTNALISHPKLKKRETQRVAVLDMGDE